MDLDVVAIGVPFAGIETRPGSDRLEALLRWRRGVLEDPGVLGGDDVVFRRPLEFDHPELRLGPVVAIFALSPAETPGGVVVDDVSTILDVEGGDRAAFFLFPGTVGLQNRVALFRRLCLDLDTHRHIPRLRCAVLESHIAGVHVPPVEQRPRRRISSCRIRNHYNSPFKPRSPHS